MAANEKRKLKKVFTDFLKLSVPTIELLISVGRRPCWPDQPYLLDNYGHTLDSVLGKMPHKVEGHFRHLREPAGGV